MSEPFAVEHDLDEYEGVRKSTVKITRVSDGSVCTVYGHSHKYTPRVPTAVCVYYHNGDAQTWSCYEGDGTTLVVYRHELDSDFVAEIDRQIPLMLLMLS